MQDMLMLCPPPLLRPRHGGQLRSARLLLKRAPRLEVAADAEPIGNPRPAKVADERAALDGAVGRPLHLVHALVCPGAEGGPNARVTEVQFRICKPKGAQMIGAQ